MSNEIGRCLRPLAYCHPGAKVDPCAPPYTRRDGLTLSKRRYAGREIRRLLLPFTLLRCDLLRYSLGSLLWSGLLRHLLRRGFLDSSLLRYSPRSRLLHRFLDRRFLRRLRSRPIHRLLLGRRVHFHRRRSWRWCGGWRWRGSRSGSRSSNGRRSCFSRGRFHFKFHSLFLIAGAVIRNLRLQTESRSWRPDQLTAYIRPSRGGRFPPPFVVQSVSDGTDAPPDKI